MDSLQPETMDIAGMDTKSKLRTIWDTMDRQMDTSVHGSTVLCVGPPTKTSRFETMDEDERNMQRELRHQHTMRTAAELRLINSIDAERKSYSLAKPPPERDLLSEMALTTAYFGGPRDYVRYGSPPYTVSLTTNYGNTND